MMKDLWTLIPAAGLSERFRQAGYYTPKPLLRIRDNTGRTMRMYEHVLERVPRENVLVALPAGCCPVGDSQIMHVEKTMGQADTVMQMLRRVPDGARVLVHDCDVLLPQSSFPAMIRVLDNQDTVVAVVDSQDPNLSRIDDCPLWTKCVEKQNPVRWRLGVVGARMFRRARDIRLDLASVLSVDPAAYLSAAMNIGWPGAAVVVSSWTDWGTPEAVRASGAEIVP